MSIPDANKLLVVMDDLASERVIPLGVAQTQGIQADQILEAENAKDLQNKLGKCLHERTDLYIISDVIMPGGCFQEFIYFLEDLLAGRVKGLEDKIGDVYLYVRSGEVHKLSSDPDAAVNLQPLKEEDLDVLKSKLDVHSFAELFDYKLDSDETKFVQTIINTLREINPFKIFASNKKLDIKHVTNFVKRMHQVPSAVA